MAKDNVGSGGGSGAGGLGAAVAALGRGSRPLLKGAIIGYLKLSHRVRSLRAEAVEQFQDLYAEGRAEALEARAGIGMPPPPDRPSAPAEPVSGPAPKPSGGAPASGDQRASSDRPPSPRPPRPRAGRAARAKPPDA